MSGDSPTTRPTPKPEDLTVDEFLEAIRASGRAHDADRLGEDLQSALGQSVAELGPMQWGDVVAGLRETLNATSQAVFAGQPSDDSEVLLGDALPDERALQIMRGLNPEWRDFKRQTMRR